MRKRDIQRPFEERGNVVSITLLPILKHMTQSNWVLVNNNFSKSPMGFTSATLKMIKDRRKAIRRSYTNKWRSYYDAINIRTIDSLISKEKSRLNSTRTKDRPIMKIKTNFLRKAILMKRGVKANTQLNTNKPEVNISNTYNFIGNPRTSSRKLTYIQQEKYREVIKGIEKIKRVIILQKLPNNV